VIQFVNAPTTLRLSGETYVPAARGIDGDVAVVGGSVRLGGRINGALIVVNGDLLFEPGAAVGGDVLVVGGAVRNAGVADVAGELRSYTEPLRFRRSGDTLAYVEGRMPWPPRRQAQPTDGSQADFVVSLGGTYNRVEGIPVTFGPRLDLRLTESMRLQVNARAMLRTAEDFSLDEGRFGYKASGELVFGSRQSNLGLGGRVYDEVTSVEAWPLRTSEAGWASFLIHDDYRDWYRREGGGVYATIRPSRSLALTVEGREERHYSQVEKDPFSLFDNEDAWRINPVITDGRYRTVGVGLRLDTRNDRQAPSSGFFLAADFEATEGTDITGPVDPTIVCVSYPCVPPSLEDGKLTYQRGMLDARSYLRLAPSARLNLRLVAAGALGGDDLPLQYRHSLGFPDPLPGFAFRQYSCGGAEVAGNPALCDRVIVGQLEYRTHLGFDFAPDWANDWGDTESDWEPFHISGPDIVFFADAGRAWQVGNDPGEIPSDKLPTLDSFSADIGLGLDLGPIGFYFAKALGGEDRPVTFHVRLGRRF
jgi:hypothetical protein